MQQLVRTIVVVGLLAASTAVLAATQKTGTQLRRECYRELGYTARDADRPRQAVILQVDQCVSRKQASGR